MCNNSLKSLKYIFWFVWLFALLGNKSFVLQSFVLHIIFRTHHFSYTKEKTSFVTHIICPTLHLYYTSFVQIARKASFVPHFICPTHHLSYTSIFLPLFVLQSEENIICPTLHLYPNNCQQRIISWPNILTAVLVTFFSDFKLCLV